jgi:hypothetical protein
MTVALRFPALGFSARGFSARLSLRASLAVALFCCTLTPFKVSAAELVLDDATLQRQEVQAASATPREQCFLYAELVHNLTELAGQQIAQGDMQSAGTTLRRIDMLAQKIHMTMARDTKRLKNAELLLHHTTRRLTDMLHITASEDRAVVESTLKHLDQVQSELLTQVFAH